MPDAAAITAEIDALIQQQLDAAEAELGRPLDEDEMNSVVDELLAGLDEAPAETPADATANEGDAVVLDEATANAASAAELDMTPEKACKVVKDGGYHTADGKWHDLTDAQKGLFGKRCGERDRKGGGTHNAEAPADLPPPAQEEEEAAVQGELFANAATKTDGGEKLTADDYGYVPDPKMPSTWKLRIDDARHVGAAIAAIGKGYRGQKVDIPAADLPAVKARLRKAWLKFNHDKGKADLPDVIANADAAGVRTFARRVFSTSNHRGAVMAELSAAERQQVLERLTANCGCQETPWSKRDAETLNAMSDESLLILDECQKHMAANADMMSMADCEKYMKDKQKGMAMNAAPETPEAIIGRVFPGMTLNQVQSAVKKALADEARERADVAAQLQAIAERTAVPGKKELIGNFLGTNPGLEALRQQLVFAREAPAEQLQPVGNWLGAAGAPVAQPAVTEEALELPSYEGLWARK